MNTALIILSVLKELHHARSKYSRKHDKTTGSQHLTFEAERRLMSNGAQFGDGKLDSWQRHNIVTIIGLLINALRVTK